LSSFLC